MATYLGGDATLEISTNSGSTYISLGCIQSIGDITISTTEVETTCLGAAAKTYRVSTTQEFQPFDVVLIFDPGNSVHEDLESVDDTEFTFRITMDDGTGAGYYYVFTGKVNQFVYGGFTNDGVITGTATIRPTSDFTKTSY
ncbi:hypothetical protein [Bremerella sp. P1]|uniref:hypothetical protein n=1 Tax=Bremerella sp. P1 TaxID=3026424 RepID=UPI0023688472|nr:hypothetical protein [Bremerella sp. P1]WDI41824.1 hypothetical protein PSR63_25565 [Bremerella sp. P1]